MSSYGPLSPVGEKPGNWHCPRDRSRWTDSPASVQSARFPVFRTGENSAKSCGRARAGKVDELTDRVGRSRVSDRLEGVPRRWEFARDSTAGETFLVVQMESAVVCDSARQSWIPPHWSDSGPWYDGLSGRVRSILHDRTRSSSPWAVRPASSSCASPQVVFHYHRSTAEEWRQFRPQSESRDGFSVRRPGSVVRPCADLLSVEPAEPAGGCAYEDGVPQPAKRPKICKVSQQTIIRCFDNGQLKGFRVPGSKFRRIPREALYKFMKDNGIPTDALEKWEAQDSARGRRAGSGRNGRTRPSRSDGRVRSPHRVQRLRRGDDGEGLPPGPHHPRRDAAGHQRQGSLPPRPRWPVDGRCSDYLHLRLDRGRQDSGIEARRADEFIRKPFDVDHSHRADVRAVGDRNRRSGVVVVCFRRAGA